MIKRAVRARIQRAREWVAEKEVEPQLDCGAPPFLYEDANSFFKKMLMERGLRRPHYAYYQALNNN